MKALFLDDNLYRAEVFKRLNLGAICVETSEECIELLGEDWDLVSLDHDLGGEYFVDSDREDCGMEVVRYIALNQPEHLRSTEFIVHSHNTEAAGEMVEILTSAGYSCVYKPFSFFA